MKDLMHAMAKAKNMLEPDRTKRTGWCEDNVFYASPIITVGEAYENWLDGAPIPVSADWNAVNAGPEGPVYARDR